MAAVTITTGVDFGSTYDGLLGLAGYTVYTLSGGAFSIYQARTRTGIATLGSVLGATFSGQIGTIYFVAWDTGGSSPTTKWQIVAGQVFQSGDLYAVNAGLIGIALTGFVAASPSPTPTMFTVTLDSPISGSAVSNDFVGLYVTFRSGAREPSFQRILGCAINSTTSLALMTNAFAGAPVNGDLVMISG